MRIAALFLLLCLSFGALSAQDPSIEETAEKEIPAEEADKEQSKVSEWSNITVDVDMLFSDDAGETGSAAAENTSSGLTGLTGAGSPIAVHGQISGNIRYLVRSKNPADAAVGGDARALVSIQYTDRNSEANFGIFLDTSLLFYEKSTKTILRSILRDVYFKLFYDIFTLKAGYTGAVWAQHDAERVMDVLNVTDRRLFMDYDVLANRVSQPLVQLNFFLSNWGMLEFIYLPVFIGGDIVDENIWKTRREKEFAEKLYSVSEPPTDEPAFSHAQVATRLTASISPVDIVLLYYYGYLKQLSARVSSKSSDADVQLFYDRTHVLGASINAGLGAVILGVQCSYYITQRTLDQLRYAVFLDARLPFSNFQMILRMTGLAPLGGVDYEAAEVEPNEYYKRLLFQLNLRDSYLRMIINPEISIGYELFSHDVIIQVACRVLLHVNASITLRTVFFENALQNTNGPYSQYTENDHVEILFTYNF